MSEFWRDRPTLVTGGAGFVGSHVVEQLVAAGARVRVCVRSGASSVDALAGVRGDVEIVEADLDDRRGARRVVRDQSVILHLAARVAGIQYNLRHPASMFIDNLRPFTSLVSAAHDERADCIVLVSSACIYPSGATVPTPEEEGFHGQPDAANEGYGWAKRMEEFLASAAEREFGLSMKIVRPFNAYGPRDNFDPRRAHVIPSLIRRAVAGEDPLLVWGDGRATRAFVYVSDVAHGILRAAEAAPDCTALNLGSDEEVSIADLVDLIVELAGARCAIRFDPRGPAGQPRRSCDGRRARAMLGDWATVPLREGLSRTIEWYRSHAARA